MQFHLGHPDYPDYGFSLAYYGEEIQKDINRLAPVSLISGTYDWPKWYSGFRGWTDTVNSLWWPQGADKFATCVLLIDDSRNDQLVRLLDRITADQGTTSRHWPHLVLTTSLSPPYAEQPGESFPNAGLPPVRQLTRFVEWKLYPLAPVNVTAVANDQERFRGLWLLPLVDVRYFMRNTSLKVLLSGSSSSSGSGCPGEKEGIQVHRDQSPDWMPPLLTYPQDLFPPANYVAIPNDTHPDITAGTPFGEAADMQAQIENWRVVCRDIRTNYNVVQGGLAHTEFTGVVSDYPEDWSLANPESYHIDACNFIDDFRSRVAGGQCDVRSLDKLTARKLQFLFGVRGDDVFYGVVIRAKVNYPKTLDDLEEDVSEPTEDEKKLTPTVVLGVQAPGRSPSPEQHTDLVDAARQWALLYYAWRHRQAYLKFPGIYPVVPNGHAQAIRWDFSCDAYETTYIALEGVQGTGGLRHSVTRQPFYARIDGEGSIDDALQGYYAWTEMLDKDGNFHDHPSPRRGYVAGVNGEYETINPGRDDGGKVAVPVGLVVWMKPGVPFLDVRTCMIFDHYRFTTSSLLQIVKVHEEAERNAYGHYSGVVQRWNPDTKGFVDSEDIWVIVLD
jgi:hypothetical protein